MSRIQRALEKASKMRASREATERAYQMPAESAPLRSFDLSVFEAIDGGVDKASVDTHIVSITDPYSHAAEEYRKLRARILRATEKNFQNTIMVTSSQANEGKTVTAINLAVTIAQELDHTVLLIDADLRKPSIHTYLGLRPSYGLSDFLTSGKPLSDILVKTGIGKLVLLPAGSPPENPAELVASERMRELIREVKERYRDRYIICDSSPLLLAADSLSLCDYMDGVIFVTRAGSTDPKTAKEALSLIKDYNVIGTVLNSVRKYPTQNRYPYYYRYGSAVTDKKTEHADGRDNGREPKNI